MSDTGSVSYTPQPVKPQQMPPPTINHSPLQPLSLDTRDTSKSAGKGGTILSSSPSSSPEYNSEGTVDEFYKPWKANPNGDLGAWGRMGARVEERYLREEAKRETEDKAKAENIKNEKLRQEAERSGKPYLQR
jgi:hypothetical protein